MKMFRKTFKFVVLLAGLSHTPSLFACAYELGRTGKVGESREPALPILFEIWDDVPLRLNATISNSVQTALQVVASSTPHKDNLFEWKGDRSGLQNKSLHFIVTSQKAFVDMLAGGQIPPPSHLEASDSMTMGMGKPGNAYDIYCFLFYDKLFYDPSFSERPDALARVVVAVAYEVYGNVQRGLELDLNRMPPPTPLYRAESEVSSFQAAIDFLNRFTLSLQYHQLSAKLREDFVRLREKDRRALAGWQAELARLKNPQ